MRVILAFILTFGSVFCSGQNFSILYRSYGLLSTNDARGTAKVDLRITASGKIYLPGDRKNLRIIWPNGDSISKSYQVPAPGVYTISVKDITLGDTGVYFHGLPDAISTETAMVINTPPCYEPNFIRDTSFLFRSGENDYCWRTYTDLRECYDEACDTARLITHRPLYRGYWSGMTDKILVTYQKAPVLFRGSLHRKNGHILMTNRWFVTHL
jgi:hypothetical protein